LYGKENEMNEDNKNTLILAASLLLITVLTGILITASGKALVLEIDGLSGRKEDSDGSYEERNVDGGRFKFYAE
jgi:hypothetical protein